MATVIGAGAPAVPETALNETAARAAAPVASVDPDFQEAVASVLAGPIVCHGGHISTLQAPLHEIEALSVRGAVPRRVREFTAGRTAARVALNRLGYEDVAIPVGKRRQPVWPNGVTGSISHAGDYCVAAVCTRGHFSGIGVDIEQATPLADNLIDLVCTRDERLALQDCVETNPGLIAKFMFSAKEAVFKCLFPIYGEELEFDDVSLDLALHEGRYTAHVSRFALNADRDLEVHGRFNCTSRLVITAAVLHDDDIQHLTGWNPGSRLDGCVGRFICGSGNA